MKIAHHVSEIREAEAKALSATPALPPDTLMQRAAAGLATAIVDFLGGIYGARVLLLVGSGDNGGDALMAGVMLVRRGAVVEALVLRDNPYLRDFVTAGGRVVEEPGRRPDVVVDGIVGIGGRPGLDERVVSWLRDLDGVPVVAVDVPSGVDVDDATTPDAHVVADLTVTFGGYKPCHFADPAALAAGAVRLVDVDLDLSSAANTVCALTASDVSALLRWPRDTDHKYTRGVVGLRTGSARYPGAAVLSVAGAAVGLCGMVRYVGPATDAVVAHHPEVVTQTGRVQAWVIGSGGEDSADAWTSVRDDGVPVVVDAGSLAYALHGRRSSPLVLTPHAGELAAVLNVSRAEVEASPLRFARDAAQRFEATVLLKCRRSITAEPRGQVRVTTSGTPWLAVAGAGDVLAGVIGALLASGMDSFDAASVGSWLHGAAASAVSRGGPLTAMAVAAAVRNVVSDGARGHLV